MYRGELVALLDAQTAEREEVGLLMATGRRDQAALAEATSSMTADLQLGQGTAELPPIGAEEPPRAPPAPPSPPADDDGGASS
jgi:hypothetical protein